ncbi:Hypothetical protein R9X50_00304700 [Acrodontium crateriforme]|uniref:UBC core domain-containing protein n=1 Tax=Acrodontium crateriforme TaxID=150365 RepID=A0AAQ3R751_9PEZI|nr:Hypothetical protein R9X50_00304700 [Acrodontium crateriforme]
MPRRQYVADLERAQLGVLPSYIHDLNTGDDDGMFEFVFTTLNEPQIAVKVTAMIPDVSDYPKSHSYTLFCDDNAPSHICKAIQEIPGTNHKTVLELLEMTSIALFKAASGQDGDTQMPDSQDDNEWVSEEDSDADDVYSSDHEAFDEDFRRTTLHGETQAIMRHIDKKALQAIRTRIRSDLAAAKLAGFRIGHFGGLLDGQMALVVVSILVSKLGISEEAMQAWQIVPTDYLTLLIKYPVGYISNEDLQSLDPHQLKQSMRMRVCMGKSYKPSLQDTIKAFTIVDKPDSVISTALPASQDQAEGFATRETFISKPLMGLLEERLTPILRYRSMGLTWNGAEKFYNDISSGGASGMENAPAAIYFEPEATNSSLPDIVNGDQYADKCVKQYSFPLLAMQFMLRHFVRCTEFCLVCHRHLATDLEAIKPYVCDNPLCLYQYMTLGFGPSIEHEILAQPFVVDLLISFCYSSAQGQRLRDYPDGLALMVPPLDVSASVAFVESSSSQIINQPEATSVAARKVAPATTYHVRVDLACCEMIFDDASSACPLRKGNWIVLKLKDSAEVEQHCRISDVTYYPIININEPIPCAHQVSIVIPTPNVLASEFVTAVTTTPDKSPNYKAASFQVYDQDFEQYSGAEKCQTICTLLDTLPDVRSMQKFLNKPGSADLKRWVHRISPPALSLLRWIIASNRACIMQVDGHDADNSTAENLHSKSSLFSNSEDRVHGMEDYMQFRFAMGAPDKEQRFIDEVRKTTQRLRLKYPTLFAWHGSPLQNWHTIIREGLHFKDTFHGRAHGHGVYHAKDANTSTGYAGMRGRSGASERIIGWQNSVLNIKSALALNEVVNAPSEFISQFPYYVVAQLDWIQTRFLFVSCQPTAGSHLRLEDNKAPVNHHPQDPAATPTGMNGREIIIPASAIRPKSNDKRKLTFADSPVKKLRLNSNRSMPFPTEPNPSDDSDCASIVTLDEDVAIFREDEDEIPAGSTEDKTDFVPGSLVWANLPVMPPPTYAISATTKRLMKELKELRKVQDSTPLGDLGWYLDTDKIENPYQWIVELHSFHLLDKNLPLVQDMKKKNIKSIILEVRFNKDFPYTPPYIRVVRPRFVGFNQGGGGHIVLGGAMCMELLTNSGWSSVSSMESVLMQVRLAITSDPPAKIDMYTKSDYGVAEAAEGYERACRTHGWAVPPGFREMALFGGN